MEEQAKMHHGFRGLRGAAEFCRGSHQRARGDRFGRMFDDLPALYVDPGILVDLGDVNGPMRAKDTSDRTEHIDVGMVFFGQFVDHDITLDASSSLGQVTDPVETENVRTPTLDLDCVYGAGPEAQPYLYHQGSPGDPFTGAKLAVNSSGGGGLSENDLVRADSGRAIIGDHRNDENRIISQMQLAMIRAHNRICDEVNDSSGSQGHDLFIEARRLLTWHYQWVVLTDFLPAMCGTQVVNDLQTNGRSFFCTDGVDPFIPVEFSVAAYRFGHSMVPHEIQVQAGDSTKSLFGDIFGRGFARLSDQRAIVDWQELFDTGIGRVVAKAEKLDSKLAPILLNLPFAGSGEASLATRNLLRGQGFLLPSGENVARCLSREPREIASVSEAANALSDGRLDGNTPL